MAQQPTQNELIASLQRAATIIERLKQEVDGYHEPIAIVGMGCRFPGDANTPDAYWELLRAGSSAVGALPQERRQHSYALSPNTEKMALPQRQDWGHYLREVGLFDAHFFGISPREATWMDPQQQILLEVCVEALEHANVPINGLLESRTGVYIGLMNIDYQSLLQQVDAPDIYVATGSEISFPAGRISYSLGLRGPSMTIGTACSSSLVTTHLACQALRAKECDLALSGGVSLILSSLSSAILSKMQATSPDGLCKTFDAAADGFGRGEGCGVLVLKRLSDAQRDGDTIWALIRGSAVNHDGRSGGLTVPSGPAQEQLLRQALTVAHVDPHQVSYIEAHGTGTALGDPIEIRALGNVLCKNRQTPLIVGSAKTNIGHLEPAAGVAGLMKVILALQHKQIPPHLHFREPNPHIPWEQYPIQVPTRLLDWQATQPRLAGVSSFGLSGINSHVILEEAPPAPQPATVDVRPWHLLTLSAKTPQALQALVQRYHDHCGAQPQLALGDLCATTHIGRSHYPYRLGFVASSTPELVTTLATYLNQADRDSLLTQKTAEQPPKVAFLFTGQGAQYGEMGRELYATSPTFRRLLDECDAGLREALGASLVAVLYGEQGSAGAIDATSYTQPALFALEYALAMLWQGWGIQPAALVGHSVGELAAACVAGVFSLADGLKLVAARGRLMDALPHDGAMLAVLADEARLRQALGPYAASVALAAVNGPENLVLSGQRDAVQAVAAQLAAAGIKTRPLRGVYAFHSPLMEPMLAAFGEIAQSITYHPPKLPLISTVTGQLAGAEIATAAYWVDQVRQPVRFAAAVHTLQAQGVASLLEIGPKPILVGLAQALADSNLSGPLPGPLHLPSLREGQSDWQQLLTSVASLYGQGAAIDWIRFERDYPRRKASLPTYPFQHQRYWLDGGENTKAQKTQDPDTVAAWLATLNVDALSQQIADEAPAAPTQAQTVAQVVAALQAKQQAQALAKTMAVYLYEVAWRLQPATAPVVTPAAGARWLILADQRGVGLALAQRLQAAAQQVTLLYAATPRDTATLTSDSEQPITTAVMGAHDLASFQQRLPALLGTDAGAWQGVVHLWALDHDLPAQPKSAELLAMQQATCGTLLDLCQALHQDATPAKGVRCWVVTAGAQVVHEPAQAITAAALQATLWGMGRVISLEQPEAWGGLIDLDPAQADSAAMAAALWPELFTASVEEQVAYRQGERYVARLAPAQPVPASKPVVIQREGVYLISGGLGGLGLHTARWLAEQGARHLILTGRRGVSTQEQQTVLDDLQRSGVTVKVAQVDMADEVGMTDLFAEIAQAAQPLRGVIHTAGVASFKALHALAWDDFVAMLRPKVLGGWLLHQLTQGLDLDFFISYTSGAGIWGGKQQAHYAAANHGLDGLMAYRRSLGLPGLSIAWGPWAGSKELPGMATPEVQAMFAAMGVRAFSPQQGMAVLAALLQSTASQMTAADVQWSHLQTLYALTKPRRFLDEVAAAPTASEPARNGQPSPATSAKAMLVEQLAALAADRRLDYLQHYLQQTAGRVLGMKELPARAVGFADLGMDSLMALELRRQLEQELQLPLPATLAFEYPTVEALADYLLQEALALTEPQTVTTTPAAQHRDINLAEPIAVVSLACRFPGADTPEAFWQLLCAGADMVRTIPATRWSIEEYYDPQRPLPGKMYTRAAAFVDHVEQFDPLFFGIAPREAIGMDPQHRLLLEIGWEALERAGLAQSHLIDSRTGVFVGIGADSYSALSGGQELTQLDSHAVTSGGQSIAAGRLAYTLGLQGPTLAVDTACSSSLVTLHLACQSLRAGECDLALAGGVNLILSPVGHVALSQIQALAADGRCKTFDATADGYGRGEGGGMVVLKRLRDAQADGDPILAVIQGSAVNHDGPSSGLTVPNKRAQEKLLRQALSQAGVTPDEVAYIEAHGTGTPLGDPIELRALGAVFGNSREEPLWVGSVKTNIGHLEAAAGIAAFIKTVLAIQHGQIPPHLHFRTPNPYIEWDELAIAIPTHLQPWPHRASANQRVAGVSSFGISGTNAHIVVAAPPVAVAEVAPADSNDERTWHLLPLSAKSDAALADLVVRYLEQLRAQPAPNLADLCYSAASGRNHFSQRLALVVESTADLQTKLAALQQGQATPGVIRGSIESASPRIAFLFTGQGAQYGEMGHELYATSPTFRRLLDECDAGLREALGESLVAVLYAGQGGADAIDATSYTQPALFALEYALAMLWQGWGIQPAALVGHSVGELAAACVAGVFSLADGLKLVAARGRLMDALPHDGAMLAVLADEARLRQALGPYRASVALAAINGPENLVLSGQRDAVQAVAAQLAAAGIKTRPLRGVYAFHSPLMEPMLAAFGEIAQSITYHPPKLPLISTVTGQLAGAEIATAAYWVDQVRQPVRFADAVHTLQAQGMASLLEIGPKPILVSLAQALADSSSSGPLPGPLHLPSLREGQSDWQQLLTSVASLYGQGAAIDWIRFERDYPRRKAPLPTYPFQHQRYWLEQPKQQRGIEALRPLIDKRLYLPRPKQIVFEKMFSTATLPFLADHHVYGGIVVPGACHLSLALSGAELLLAGAPCGIEDVIFPQALTLLDDEARTVQLIVERAEQGATAAFTFHIISFVEESTAEPLLHATGRIVRMAEAAPSLSLRELQSRCPTAVSPATVYDTIAQAQLAALGPTFRWFADIWRGGTDEALAKLQMPTALTSVQGYRLFPSLIDACFQLGGATLFAEDNVDSEPLAQLPFTLAALTFYTTTNHQALWCHITHTQENKWQIVLFTTTGQVIAQFRDLQLRAVPPAAIHDNRLRTDWLYTPGWEPLPLLPPAGLAGAPPTPDCWLLFGAASGIGATLAAALAATGTPTLLVTPGALFSRTATTATDPVQQVTVDPTDPAMFKRLLTEQATHYPTMGIGYFWGLDDALGAADIGEQSLHLCGGLLHLVQAVIALEIRTRLWVATPNGQLPSAPDGQARFSAQSGAQSLQATVAAGTLWGLGRTIALEYPQLSCTCIDLQDSTAEQQVRALQQELLLGGGEAPANREVLYQGETRSIARLHRWRPAATPAASSFTVSSTGSYLITGGLGALGLQVAQQLVADGAKYLVLSGRRGRASVEGEQILAQLAQAGAVVQTVQADIANLAEAQHLLDLCTALAPLRGIVHAAGVLDDGVLTEQTLERFAGVLRPKVNGAWHLHTLTQALELDFFICFSSSAALLGAAGQSNYAAANAFMDTLMQQRRQAGRPGLSINWGPWSEIGLAALLQERLRRQGMAMITPRQGRLLFRYLCQQSAAQIGVLPFSAHQPAQPQQLAVQEFNRQAYQAMTLEEQRAVITQLLRTLVAAIGGFTSEQIDEQESLLALGLDSLMAVQLRNQVLQIVKLSIPISLFLDGGSITSLAMYMFEQLAETAGAESTVAYPQADFMPPNDAPPNGHSVAPEDLPWDRPGGLAKRRQAAYRKMEGEL